LHAPECGAGRTVLDGVCVSQSVADYVSCVRAQGAQLGGSKSEKLSAEVGYLGVEAGGAAEVSEKLEKKYIVSDTATLEIIRACNDKLGVSPSEDKKPTPPVKTPVYRWNFIRPDDCGGRDVKTMTEGAKPVDVNCDKAFVGKIAVCWDNAKFVNGNKPQCTYKNLGPDACKGGHNTGLMYVCQAE